MDGLLVCIEGADAAGKHTNTKLLAERISRTGREAVVYSFPQYQTPLGKTILRHLKGDTAVREAHVIDSSDHMIDCETVYKVAPEDPMWFQCAMTADKYSVATTIRAHVRAGHIVICDRWVPSAVAYGIADGLNENWLWQIQDCLPKADLNIFLDCTEEESLRRRPQLRDRYEKDRAKQKAVRDIYARIWYGANRLNYPSSKWVTIDANGPTVEAVHERVWNEFTKVWPPGGSI